MIYLLSAIPWVDVSADVSDCAKFSLWLRSALAFGNACRRRQGRAVGRTQQRFAIAHLLLTPTSLHQ
jgi:hypothetical protein